MRRESIYYSENAICSGGGKGWETSVKMETSRIPRGESLVYIVALCNFSERASQLFACIFALFALNFTRQRSIIRTNVRSSCRTIKLAGMYSEKVYCYFVILSVSRVRANNKNRCTYREISIKVRIIDQKAFECR